MTSGLEFCQPSGRLIFRQRRLGSSASLKKKERKTCGLRSAALQSRANVLASFLKVTQRLGTQFSNCVFFFAKKMPLGQRLFLRHWLFWDTGNFWNIGYSCDTSYSGTLEIFGILAFPATLAILGHWKFLEYWLFLRTWLFLWKCLASAGILAILFYFIFLLIFIMLFLFYFGTFCVWKIGGWKSDANAKLE